MTDSIQPQQPLVSVVIPFRNAEDWLEHCCGSVLGQTLRQWEALLVDDDSIDQSRQIAEAIAERDGRFVVLESGRSAEHEAGPWLPRNVGLRKAKGRWVAFLDADDLWHPQKLEKQLKALDQQQANLCVTAYVRFQAESGVIRSFRTPPLRIDSTLLRAVNPLPMSSAVVERSLLKALDFRPVCHEDQDLWQRLFDQKVVRYVRLSQPLMAYRRHEQNLTKGVRNRIAMKYQNLMDTHQPLWWCLPRSAMLEMRYWLEDRLYRNLRRPVIDVGFPEAPADLCSAEFVRVSPPDTLH
ncbi:glycosyltransferase family 2 protein [Synechococcus sp. CB0205]|uniref:glycosyltransferase family 2 protein n=1 Tax=Synechococcus sp. CB0205 TaxID=232363 RepID=UPI0002001E34|nr:glycosyltransferase family 2 protein [Synechococcus sp. CB0205]